MAQQREVILPRTIVPEYLDVTPLGVQVRHEPNFDLDRLPQRHAGSSDRFPRPSMLENIALIESNLAHLGGAYFDMAWRKDEVLGDGEGDGE